MKPIIDPVPVELIERELTEDKFVRTTNFGNSQIYIFTYHDSPNLLREVGRLRELSFRTAGGGSGKDCDLDDYDTAAYPYQQLIVWDPEDREIQGGYRFMLCDNIPKGSDGQPLLATGGLMYFSDKFINEYLPVSIELGRSFVQPKYQWSKTGRKGLYSLDNLWDGLGTIAVDNPSMLYFFGKVTMYRHYNQKARDLLLYFMHKHFPDPDNLMYPKEALQLTSTESEMASILTADSYKDDYKILSAKIREYGENIPPLINSYMNLSPTMRVFGTAINHKFGGVEETGIIVKLDDIYDAKKERHIITYNGRSNPNN